MSRIRFFTASLVAVLSLGGCASTSGEPLMKIRSPDTLLTSYLVATGMAEHRLIMRVAKREATRQDVETLVAIDHNTWKAVRKAILEPSDANIHAADASLTLLLQQAPPPGTAPAAILSGQP